MTIVRGFEDLKSDREQDTKDLYGKPARLNWSGEVMAKIAKQPRQPLPSPTQLWWEDNKKLQREGKMNDIDMAEMRAAMNGSRNKWLDVVKKHPDIFKSLGEKDKAFDWEAALAAFKAMKG